MVVVMGMGPSRFALLIDEHGNLAIQSSDRWQVQASNTTPIFSNASRSRPTTTAYKYPPSLGMAVASSVVIMAIGSPHRTGITTIRMRA